MNDLGIPEAFSASTADLYRVAVDPSGPWSNAAGQACRLISVNMLGEPRWMVSPVSATATDREAATHYALEIWQFSGMPDRRRDDRRAGPRRERAVATEHDERRDADRRADSRRTSERRGAERRAEHRRGLEPRELETAANLGQRTDRRAVHRRRAELVKAGATR